MKNMLEILETVSNQMDQLKEQKITAQNANAMCNTIGKFFSGIRLQFDYCRLVNRQPDLPGVFRVGPKLIDSGNGKSKADKPRK